MQTSCCINRATFSQNWWTQLCQLWLIWDRCWCTPSHLLRLSVLSNAIVFHQPLHVFCACSYVRWCGWCQGPTWNTSRPCWMSVDGRVGCALHRPERWSRSMSTRHAKFMTSWSKRAISLRLRSIWLDTVEMCCGWWIFLFVCGFLDFHNVAAPSKWTWRSIFVLQ